jgi:very-short-patch-repair endonuclease
MWVFWLGNKIQNFIVRFLGKKICIPTSKSSKGERAVANALDIYGIKYTTQFPFGYMHVDFCITMNGKIAFIECDGQQHFRPIAHFGGEKTFFFQMLRDIVEGWECKDRGIPLLRISYNIPLVKVNEIVLDFVNKIK